jgi:hypothetical protein
VTEIQIVRGDPDECELAALLVVITTLGAVAEPSSVENPRPAPWNRPERYRSPANSNPLWFV